jgi:hypothetical protein
MNVCLSTTFAAVLGLLSGHAPAAQAPGAIRPAQDHHVVQCMDRGKLAHQLAAALAEGYGLETLNIVFPRPPGSADEQAEREAWVAKLKADIAAAAAPLDVTDAQFADKLAREVVETCTRTRGMRATNFRKTASSQALVDPQIPMRWKCHYQQHVALSIMEKARSGMPKETFWQLHPLPPDWSEAIKAEAAALVDAAYGWRGDTEGFSDRVYNACMKAG